MRYNYSNFFFVLFSLFFIVVCLTPVASASFDQYNIQWILDPPAPVDLSVDYDDTWVNWSWAAGVWGLDTDTYNVSVNEAWYNGSSQSWRNTTGVAEGSWVNISVWGFNTTWGVLSSSAVLGQQQTTTTITNEDLYNLLLDIQTEQSRQSTILLILEGLILLCIALVVVGWKKHK